MRLLALAVLLLLVGCATGPLYVAVPSPAASDEAVVYIYRPGSMTFGARKAHIFVNEISVANLSNDGYTWIRLPAGRYDLRQKWDTDPTSSTLGGHITVEPGHTYYFSVATSGAGTTRLHWKFSEVPLDVASGQIASCHYQPAFKGKLSPLPSPASAFGTQ